MPQAAVRASRARWWPWGLVVLVAVAAGVSRLPGLVRAAAAPEFDGTAAMTRLREQVDFGPRVPGTTGHARCLEYLMKPLKETTATVERQDFTYNDRGKPLPMTNVIAKVSGGSGPSTLLAAHWDTRPTADQERDPEKRKKPIPGANDGASGVAVLLQLARTFQHRPPPGPVWLVLLDGEDLGPGEDRMYLGAKYFADHLPAGTPKQGVLLDMIGDADLQIYEETNSILRAGPVVEAVWATAQRLGYSRYFIPQGKYSISDDHLPLMDKGLAVADLIDFDFPPWHTLGDTIDKCSANSLKIVGTVVAAWVYGRGA